MTNALKEVKILLSKSLCTRINKRKIVCNNMWRKAGCKVLQWKARKTHCDCCWNWRIFCWKKKKKTQKRVAPYFTTYSLKWANTSTNKPTKFTVRRLISESFFSTANLLEAGVKNTDVIGVLAIKGNGNLSLANKRAKFNHISDSTHVFLALAVGNLSKDFANDWRKMKQNHKTEVRIVQITVGLLQ